MELTELKKTWVVYYIDTDTEGFVQHMLPICYTEKESDAEIIRRLLAKDDEEPYREYKYTHL